MPPAVAPIPPWALKEILERYGFQVIAQDEFNWVFSESKESVSEPIILPKMGDLVAIDIMMQALIDAKMNLQTYFVLKEKVLGKNWGYPSTASPDRKPTVQ
jgi:hypothetical protein